MGSALKKTYVGLDFFKLICAFLIVFMHTYCYDSSIGLWIRDYISILGVPFFFITSGYFYKLGLNKAEDSKSYFLHAFKRITFMYTTWTILTLPVAWYNLSLAHSDYSSFIKIIYIIRSYFLSGSLGIYWYLLALIYNFSILFIAYKSKIAEKIIYLLSIICFIIGALYNNGTLSNSVLGVIIHTVFGSERNFLNVGLFYMSIGFLFADIKVKKQKIKYFIGLLTCICMDCTISSNFDIRFFYVLSAIFLFLFAFSLEFHNLKNISIKMRKYSIALYVGHSPFILVFDYYLRKGTEINFPLAIMFSLLLYEIVLRISPTKICKLLYG